MTWAPSSPVTGGPQSGFTTPTYTIAVDTAPDVNGKQYAVTAVGGTQTGVTVHSLSSPFTITFWKPKTVKVLGKPNPTTGLITNVPRNVFKQVTRKGVTPAVNQPYQDMVVTVMIEEPAGADTYDAPNVKAALSCSFGIVWAQSQGIGDTVLSNVM